MKRICLITTLLLLALGIGACTAGVTGMADGIAIMRVLNAADSGLDDTKDTGVP